MGEREREWAGDRQPAGEHEPAEEREPAEGREPAERLPARARVVVYAMIAAIAVAGLAQIEFWPLTAFRLFSDLRGPTQVRWELAVVGSGSRVGAGAGSGSDGRGGAPDETLVDLAHLPPALKGADHILPSLAGAPPRTSATTVRPWLEATGNPASSVVEVRVYSVVVQLGPKGRRPLVTVSRTLRARFPP